MGDYQIPEPAGFYTTVQDSAISRIVFRLCGIMVSIQV
jgi:hypothetical protein